MESHAGVDQTSEKDVVLFQNSVEDTAVHESSEEDDIAEKVDIYEDDAGVTEFEVQKYCRSLV